MADAADSQTHSQTVTYIVDGPQRNRYGIQITAELPGLEDKDVEIILENEVLVIQGEKKSDKDEKERNYRLTERRYGTFYRALELPRGVKTDDIKASMSSGVLKATVSKPEPAHARKIDIKNG